MTDQRRGATDRGGETPAPGYRGALPPRTDNMARAWVIAVLVTFVLIFLLSFAGFPSSVFPTPSPSPTPSSTPEPSTSPSGSASAAASGSASASVAPSPSPAP